MNTAIRLVCLVSILCFFTQWSPKVREKKEAKKLVLPAGWFAAGDEPDSYNMGTDEHGGVGKGKGSTIASVKEVTNGFGTLMTTIPVGNYSGKRIRLSGYMRSEKVDDWAGFWMRIDLKGQTVGEFDNMMGRAVKGTTDWKKYEVVLNVAQNASNIAYGALLAGTGQVWFDSVSIDVVGNDIPSTDLNIPASEGRR